MVRQSGGGVDRGESKVRDQLDQEGAGAGSKDREPNL